MTISEQEYTINDINFSINIQCPPTADGEKDVQIASDLIVEALDNLSEDELNTVIAQEKAARKGQSTKGHILSNITRDAYKTATKDWYNPSEFYVSVCVPAIWNEDDDEE